MLGRWFLHPIECLSCDFHQGSIVKNLDRIDDCQETITLAEDGYLDEYIKGKSSLGYLAEKSG